MNTYMNGAAGLDYGALRDHWTHELVKAKAERERLANAITGYEQLLEGLSKVEAIEDRPAVFISAPNDDAPTDPEYPFSPKRRNRARPALDNVVNVVSESRDWMVVRDVVRVLTERGELPEADNPEAAVRVALRRAAAEGRIEKGARDLRTTQYRALSPKNTNDPAATGSFGAVPTEGQGGDSDAQAETVSDHGHHDRNLNRDHDHGASVTEAR